MGSKNRSLGQIIASCGVRLQQFAFKAYSSYTPGPIDSRLGRKHRGDLRGWLGVAKVTGILCHWGFQLILASSWARPAILLAEQG